MTSSLSGSATLAFAASALALAVSGTSASAQEAVGQPVSPIGKTASRMSTGYWTSERMRNAVPMDKKASSVTQQRSPAAVPGTSVSSAGRAPAAEPAVNPSQRITLPAAKQSRSAGGSANAYTTSIVFPDSHANVYPYRAAGKIFFTDGGLNYTCSGSIVNRRMVITAAHCLYNTSANR